MKRKNAKTKVTQSQESPTARLLRRSPSDATYASLGAQYGSQGGGKIMPSWWENRLGWELQALVQNQKNRAKQMPA